MKSLLIKSAICLTLFSCKSRETKNEQNIPVAFIEKGELSISKRYSNEDPVESMFNELLEKDTSLKKVNKRISELIEMQKDSTDEFANFILNNESYYSSANTLLKQVKDSILQNSIKLALDSSYKSYQNAVLNHKNLVESSEKQIIKLRELLIGVKLLRTLNLIEKYQNENLPNKNSIISLNTVLSYELGKVDTMVHK